MGESLWMWKSFGFSHDGWDMRVPGFIPSLDKNVQFRSMKCEALLDLPQVFLSFMFMPVRILELVPQRPKSQPQTFIVFDTFNLNFLLAKKRAGNPGLEHVPEE